MRLCAISDRKQIAPCKEGEAAVERRLRALLTGWIGGGVEFIQLREKDLAPSALRALAERILNGIDRRDSKVLINLPASPESIREVALVADGIHIPGRPALGAVELVHRIFRANGRQPVVSLACHSLSDVRTARIERADFVLFAPVFEKMSTVDESLPGTAGQGLGMLERACEEAEEMPVFALGGVNVENAASCLAAGAAGVSGIRIFAQDDWRLLQGTDI